MQPPKSIRAIRADGAIEMTWPDGRVVRFPNKTLRANCACAGCVDEMTGRRILDVSAIPDDIAVESMSPVGNYALKIVWSDGHDTGLFTWERLAALDPHATVGHDEG